MTLIHTFLWLLYFLLCCIAISRMNFFRESGIKPAWLIIFFAIHVLAGCMHTWIAWRYFPGHGDIWQLYDWSVEMKQQLLHQPKQFFTDFVYNTTDLNLTDTAKPLMNAQYQWLQYMDVVLNLFSFDNLYVNTVLFSFPVFAGTIAIFRVCKSAFGHILPAFCILLLPSVIFWTSVVYKDGLLLMALGFFCLVCMNEKKWGARKILNILFWLAVMALSRTNAIPGLAIACFFYYLSRKTNKTINALAGTLVITLVLFIIFNMLTSGGIVQAITSRQHDFQSLEGGSRMELPLLEPTIKSFVKVFPRALLNGFLKPLPGEGGKPIYTFFAVELFLAWAVALWALFQEKSSNHAKLNHFGKACLVFAIPGMLMIGYMIPFAGAIVRYRFIYLAAFAIPLFSRLSESATGRKIEAWISRHWLVVE